MGAEQIGPSGHVPPVGADEMALKVYMPHRRRKIAWLKIAVANAAG